MPLAPLDLQRAFPEDVGPPSADVVTVSDRRSLDRDDHFTIDLPEDVRAAPLGPPPQLGNFSRLAQLVAEKVIVGVGALRLPREVDPLAWLELLCEASQQTVLARRVTETLGGREAELLVVSSGPVPAVIRRRILKDGERLFVVDAIVPAVDAEALGEVTARATRSFRLLSPRPFPCAEPIDAFSKRLPVDLTIRHPRSFRCEEEPGARPGVLAARWYDAERPGELGIIGCYATPKAPGDEDVRGARDRLLTPLLRREPDLVCGPLVAAPPPATSRGFLRMHEATWHDAKGARGRVAILQAERAWVGFVSLAPSRERAPARWLVADRAFDLAVGHTRHAA